ncbi:hypothetical protein CAOG_05692 [Capsaspora owczarzaki ATCC 30864]|uniref:hypothetical protein n=1 Tax=Capsaspora owczarzaki (strain ATCC 30864) TaxID=595528 RepID=UPI0001FE5979|nr:hypothetical protein CAOG_05692 [Capsaspora owczarzaki ATCC 30864]|eukprot:XP_004346365.1 hypothetical protein CAOG_05692 [Capsaspora owczarzaki ATCC 30864]
MAGWPGPVPEFLDGPVISGLWQNQIGDAGASAIAETLKVNKAVTSIAIWDNQIGDAGASAIAQALKVNTTVTRLIIWRNQIGDAGASAVAEALKVNTTVTEFDLHKNLIGDAGAQAFAELVKVNKTLAWLNLSWNCIGEVGIQAIADAREFHHTRTALRIGNQCSPLVLSLLPRLATADELQTVFGLLTSGPELENQLASLPALPTEIADLIMDEACYWQGVQRTNRACYFDSLSVTVPTSSTGNSIRVKAIQVLLDVKHVDANDSEQRVTILPANHPVMRQMREGWKVDVQPRKSSRGVRFESLHVGYIERQYA